MDLILNHKHDPQNQGAYRYLHSLSDLNFWFAGRGSGKTHHALYKAIILALTYCRGTNIAITEVSDQECKKILVPIMKRLIPQEYFRTKFVTYNVGDQILSFPRLNSHIHFKSRMAFSGGSARDPLRGDTFSYVIHDEMCKDPSDIAYLMGLATLRDSDAVHKGTDIITTPKMGWLYDLAAKFNVDNCKLDENGIADRVGKVTNRDSDGYEKSTVARAIYSRTKDNTISGSEMYGLLLTQYDELLLRQEAEAQWTPLQGRVWDSFDESLWPRGNIVNHPYDPNKPWVLSCDFGSAKSSWIAWQFVSHNPKVKMVNDSWGAIVAVNEWHFDGGGADYCLQRIKSEMPSHPYHTYTGHDVDTRDVASGQVPNYFLHKTFPETIISKLSGKLLDPHVRNERLRHAILDAHGTRRFLVGRHLLTHKSTRSVINVMRQDSWPNPNQRSNSLFTKDGKLEHCRDAIHHMICHYDPPRYDL